MAAKSRYLARGGTGTGRVAVALDHLNHVARQKKFLQAG